MIRHQTIITTNPTTGRFRGMLACNVFDGNSLDGLSNYIEKFSWFMKFLHQIAYFKSFTGTAHIFVNGDNFPKLEKLLKNHGLVFYRSKYDHDYYKYNVLIRDIDMVALKLST